MSTTNHQDRDFISSVISSALLGDAISWIASNMQPEDVFSVSQLKEWASENGFTEEQGNE